MDHDNPTPSSDTEHDDAPNAHILVIDDEEVVNVSLRRILGRRGHTVETTTTASEGLEKIATADYDMVITDLMMPEMNGIELLQELKSRHISVPILMITGYPTITTALQALRLGAVDYLAKPFTRQELLAPVNRALRRRASQERISILPPTPLPRGEGPEPPEVLLEPGDRCHLRRHAWIVYQQDGTVEAGIEPSFLNNIGTVEAIELPEKEELVEQGHVGIRLMNTAGEKHSMFMPLSGRVIAVNTAALEDPSSITPSTWLVRLLPDRLSKELPLLVRG